MATPVTSPPQAPAPGRLRALSDRSPRRPRGGRQPPAHDGPFQHWPRHNRGATPVVTSSGDGRCGPTATGPASRRRRTGWGSRAPPPCYHSRAHAPAPPRRQGQRGGAHGSLNTRANCARRCPGRWRRAAQGLEGQRVSTLAEWDIAAARAPNRERAIGLGQQRSSAPARRPTAHRLGVRDVARERQQATALCGLIQPLRRGEAVQHYRHPRALDIGNSHPVAGVDHQRQAQSLVSSICAANTRRWSSAAAAAGVVEGPTSPSATPLGRVAAGAPATTSAAPGACHTDRPRRGWRVTSSTARSRPIVDALTPAAAAPAIAASGLPQRSRCAWVSITSTREQRPGRTSPAASVPKRTCSQAKPPGS